MRKLLSFVLTWFAILGILVSSAEAAKRKPKRKSHAPSSKGQIVSAEQVFSVKAKIKVGKKSKSVNIICLDRTPGEIKQAPNGLLFTAYALTIKKLQKQRSPKLNHYKLLLRAGKNSCIRPAFLSLDRYKGPFGVAEAMHLFDRASYGASPERIQEAVQDGLERTVAKLITPAAEDPGVTAAAADLACDHYFSDHPQNKQCDSRDPNDFDIYGEELAFYYRVLHTPNAFFYRMMQWIMDERGSANPSVLWGEERWAFHDYLSLIQRTAFTGDMKGYVKGMSLNYLWAGRYLDLFTPASEYVPGSRPNQNAVRELLELVSLGPYDTDGQANYTTTDIERMAEIFSGWLKDCFNGENFDICTSSLYPAFQSPGPWMLFEGKPGKALVHNSDEAVQAIVNNPAFARNLAKELYEGFINPFATPSAINELAEIIRKKNFNLIDVMREIFLSNAFFEARSRKSLIKDPLDVVLGFLRQTKIPYALDPMHWELYQMSQNVFEPPTVFGWNALLLASQARVLPARRTIDDIVSQSDQSLETEGFNLYNRFLTGLGPGLEDSRKLVRDLSQQLNVPLTDAQVEILVNMLNVKLRTQNGQTTEIPDAFDPREGSSNRRWKLEDLLLALATLDMYRLK